MKLKYAIFFKKSVKSFEEGSTIGYFASDSYYLKYQHLC